MAQSYCPKTKGKLFRLQSVVYRGKPGVFIRVIVGPHLECFIHAWAPSLKTDLAFLESAHRLNTRILGVREVIRTPEG